MLKTDNNTQNQSYSEAKANRVRELYKSLRDLEIQINEFIEEHQEVFDYRARLVSSYTAVRSELEGLIKDTGYTPVGSDITVTRPQKRSIPLSSIIPWLRKHQEVLDEHPEILSVQVTAIDAIAKDPKFSKLADELYEMVQTTTGNPKLSGMPKKLEVL